MARLIWHYSRKRCPTDSITTLPCPPPLRPFQKCWHYFWLGKPHEKKEEKKTHREIYVKWNGVFNKISFSLSTTPFNFGWSIILFLWCGLNLICLKIYLEIICLDWIDTATKKETKPGKLIVKDVRRLLKFPKSQIFLSKQWPISHKIYTISRSKKAETSS